VERKKTIRGKDLSVCVPKLRELWTNLIHYCEIPFSYDSSALKQSVGELRDYFINILTGKITEKNLQLLSATMDYLVEEKMLLLLFENDDHEEMKKDMGKILRESWALVFKDKSSSNPSSPSKSPTKAMTTATTTSTITSTTTTTATTTTTTVTTANTASPENTPEKTKKT